MTPRENRLRVAYLRADVRETPQAGAEVNYRRGNMPQRKARDPRWGYGLPEKRAAA